MVAREGKILIRSGANVWPHELKTAESSAAAGHTVEFVRRSEGQRAQSTDILMLGEVWEMKAPRSDKSTQALRSMRRLLFVNRKAEASCNIRVAKRPNGV